MIMFGKRIRELRKTAGLNQADLAEKIGVARPNISFWENSPYPPLEAITRICKALNIDIAEFFLTDDIKTKYYGIDHDILQLTERLSQLPGEQLNHILDIFSVILEKYDIMQNRTSLSSLGAGETDITGIDAEAKHRHALSEYNDNTDSLHRLPFYARHAGKIALEQYFNSLAWLSN